MNWNTEHIPDLTGKIAIVTGGNTGLGFQISLELAKKNAHVIIACRTISKGEHAIQRINTLVGKPLALEVIPLDLTNFKSIQTFTSKVLKQFHQLDILINNAGVVNLKERQQTPSGLEMHMATNHYGHFTLTGHLFPLLLNTPKARVVTMSSGGYRNSSIDFNDLNWTTRPYDRAKSYGASKLANLLFMQKLQEKFEDHNASVISLSAHPGLSATERQQTIGIGGWLTKILAQPVYMGALPALRAATDVYAKPRAYYGPRWLMRGYPKLEQLKPNALDMDVAEQLWKHSEQVTGVHYNI